eukprot:284818683_2
MAVQAFWNGSKLAEGKEPTTGGDGEQCVPVLPEKYREILAEAIAINSTAFLEESETKGIGGTQETFTKHVGSATECALLEMLKVSVSLSNHHSIFLENGILRHQTPTWIGYSGSVYFPPQCLQILHRIPFSSKRKLMTTAVRISPEKYRVYVKGAAEIVLHLCRRRIDSAGQLRLELPISSYALLQNGASSYYDREASDRNDIPSIANSLSCISYQSARVTLGGGDSRQAAGNLLVRGTAVDSGGARRGKSFRRPEYLQNGDPHLPWYRRHEVSEISTSSHRFPEILETKFPQLCDAAKMQVSESDLLPAITSILPSKSLSAIYTILKLEA